MKSKRHEMCTSDDSVSMRVGMGSRQKLRIYNMLKRSLSREIRRIFFPQNKPGYYSEMNKREHS
jgi:hypothetical protein